MKVKFNDRTHIDGLIPGEMCCMKVPNPNGGMPERFGVIFGDNPTVLFPRGKNGEILGGDKALRFASVEEMLREGWIVD